VDEYYLTTRYWVCQVKFGSKKIFISCGKWFKVVEFFQWDEKFLPGV
jgi:hypothetical protein